MALRKIHSPDPILNQVQDQLIADLTPVLRRLASTPTVTGSTGGNAALKSLIAALEQIGLVKDETT